jgi:predicted TIM-barrel fold metal-dependent hydrolase
MGSLDNTTDTMQSRARAKLERLVAERGIKPVTIEELRQMGDPWPEDESVDDFVKAVREWRSERHRIAP